ncbi:uncharacterized protein B0T15DRAFT_257140 [Chaetomium strumarium]|uniref:MYND-type domain-containing protein n=1 Tax=Chaetomium strumarium TaxID=1170767 RepID=A0AAJ0GMU7_9PEZI|nr:hypothetical protein B0T15DRAFT_257140 [Chaetomium strumarium]
MSETAASEADQPCPLGYCTTAERSVPAAVQALFWKTRFMDVSKPDSMGTSTGRREIVALASAVIRSPDDGLIHLESLASSGSVNLSKILAWWKRLARPITILQTLATIARLLPNFGTVRFIPLEVPPPIRLRNRQTPSLIKAWTELGLPSAPDGSIPAAVSRRTRDFKADCSRELAIHCEIQLLTRYEAEPSQAPTLAYFGCSKKACFLCYEFLALSPLKPGVRGRHGTCHPSWAVPPLSLGLRASAADDGLSELCNVIKGQIQRFLSPGRPHSPPKIVCQSSAVSELKTGDMVHLSQMAADRKAAEQAAKELRERMQILLNPACLRGQTKIYCRDIRTLCAMCQFPGVQCTGCYAISYCSKRCQAIDWPAHKLLCRKFLPFLETRPSVRSRVGIFFPRNQDSPRLVWVPFRDTNGEARPAIFDHFLGPLLSDSLSWTLPVKVNKRRGFELGHLMTIYYADYDEFLNRSAHRTVEACVGMTVPTTLEGHYVVLSGPPLGGANEHGDMTLADFRHILDFWSVYYDETIYSTPRECYPQGLKICSPLERRLYGHEMFTLVWVESKYGWCSTSTISSLSVALVGFAVRVCAVRETEAERQSNTDVEGGDWKNPYAEALLIEIDPSSGEWGKSNSNSIDTGSAVLLREDKQDLDAELAEWMCRYCVGDLQPLFERCLRGEVSRSEVLAAISQESFTGWVKLQR